MRCRETCHRRRGGRGRGQSRHVLPRVVVDTACEILAFDQRNVAVVQPIQHDPKHVAAQIERRRQRTSERDNGLVLRRFAIGVNAVLFPSKAATQVTPQQRIQRISRPESHPNACPDQPWAISAAGACDGHIPRLGSGDVSGRKPDGCSAHASASS